jgi:hypothetical protein
MILKIKVMDEEMNIKGLLPWSVIDNIMNDEED